MTIATILRIINIKSAQQLGQVWLAATEAGGSLQLQPGAPANFLLQDFSRSFFRFPLISRCISQSCNFEFHSQVEILSGRLKYKLIGKVGLYFLPSAVTKYLSTRSTAKTSTCCHRWVITDPVHSLNHPKQLCVCLCHKISELLNQYIFLLPSLLDNIFLFPGLLHHPRQVHVCRVDSEAEF